MPCLLLSLITLFKKDIILTKNGNETCPKLPTAPPIDDGQGYRLPKINEIQAFSENEIQKGKH